MVKVLQLEELPGPNAGDIRPAWRDGSRSRAATLETLAGNVPVDAHAGATLHHQLQSLTLARILTVPIRHTRSLATTPAPPTQSPPPLLLSSATRPRPAAPDYFGTTTTAHAARGRHRRDRDMRCGWEA
ncbi:hypothetical protein SNOG_08331 [Parastagonospora nodorum SN15]|uniref:Uncharacterized protein n=1 Tax=Phaeosphaeria nodorum (strain SN15 / ATCC MYA-4574 / FGSC 10173) TaxID=321614 RepID=Q0UIT3_PHANO|nr:hypothetical protein SNOG_08331 [Parastagonospora nodorum SN15]EAT84607.1 hypothetical protein SNOG_08331 [Parastagonospora nodorum SN15]